MKVVAVGHTILVIIYLCCGSRSPTKNAAETTSTSESFGNRETARRRLEETGLPGRTPTDFTRQLSNVF